MWLKTTPIGGGEAEGGHWFLFRGRGVVHLGDHALMHIWRFCYKGGVSFERRKMLQKGRLRTLYLFICIILFFSTNYLYIIYGNRMYSI